MKRIEKIDLLIGIKDRTRSIYDLRPSKFYLLDCGVITDFATEIELTVEKLCKRFIPGKDMILPIGYTFHNLPAEHNFSDPSGGVLSEIIKVFPELTKEFSELIETAKDLKNTEFYKLTEGT